MRLVTRNLSAPECDAIRVESELRSRLSYVTSTMRTASMDATAISGEFPSSLMRSC